MVFQVSPGIVVQEIDLTGVVPAVATTTGGIAGLFRWGPLGLLTLVSNESDLVNVYQKPSNYNAETFFAAANFLAYGNALQVSRAGNTSGSSNTLQVNYTNTTSLVVENTANAGSHTGGLAVGDLVYGPGVSTGTIVSNVSVANATTANSVVTLSKVVSNTTNGNYLVFANPNTLFTAICNASTFTAKLGNHIVRNRDVYDTAQQNFQTTVPYVAKYPGALGNSLKVSVCDNANQFVSNINLLNFNSNVSGNSTSTNLTVSVGSNSAVITVANATGANDINTTGLANNIANALTVGDFIYVGNSTIGFQYLQINATPTVVTVNTSGTNTGTATVTIPLSSPYTLSTNAVHTNFNKYWQYYSVVETAPGQTLYQRTYGNNSANDSLHVVVVDRLGQFTGTPESVLEVWTNLSRATDAKTENGEDNYYKNVINRNSRYIWWSNDRSGAASNTALNLTTASTTSSLTLNFQYGSDGSSESAVSFGPIASAYDLFADPNSVDIALLIAGKSIGGTYGEQLGNYLIDNISGSRKDCIAFITTPANTVVANSGATVGNETTSVVTWANQIRSSSYAVLTSGYKYQYDKYNDIYRYVPDNGDIAGLCVRTDLDRDPWWSPAGYNRGQIKNLIKLAFNPTQAQRDILYPSRVNPVITTPGLGTILFGDKTSLSLPSAFDRINVRRLFIVLEKAIARIAKTFLFEFNDEFTRAQFVSIVTPYLRDIQGRRGITAFRVICDETNNTAEVINRNEFVGSILVRPARSINYITLKFVAVRDGVSFEEIVGGI